MPIIIASTPGPQGAPGNTILTTSGTPANTVGNNGDYALDPTAQLIYGPKAAGVWPAGTSYKGINGTNGTNGVAGAQGPVGRGITSRILCPGSFLVFNSTGTTQSNGTDTGANSFQILNFPGGGTDIQLIYSNVRGNNPITVTASVKLTGGFIGQATWRGQTSITIPAGACSPPSDPVPSALVPPGGTAEIRTFVSCSAGGIWPLQSQNSNGYVSGTSQTDQTMNYSFNYGSAGQSAFLPAAIIGAQVVRAPAWVVYGDSIFRGALSGPPEGLPMTGALGGIASTTHPFVNAAFLGMAGSGLVSNSAPYRSIGRYADYAVSNYGTNDLNGSGWTLAQLQADSLQWFWALSVGLGVPLYQGTMIPRTNSTDGWTTTTNQTPFAGFGAGGVRCQWNDWLRAGAPILNNAAVAIVTSGALVAGQAGHPLAGYIELADTVESARNSGFWKITLGSLTPDGTHPNTLGATQMQVPLTTLVNSLP